MIDMNELNVFQKYCDNRVNLDEFEAMMTEIYPHGGAYVTEKWPAFTANPVRFITSRRETALLNMIADNISDEGYIG